MQESASLVQAASADSATNGRFAFTGQPWFAYLMLALLQLKVVWRIWDYRDLTSGDTSSYYLLAWGWYQDLTVNLAWSPLYTAYYGSFHFLTADVATATLLHRLVIVFASSLLVLALFRRLMPPGIAWLAAAWWAILPINFNTLYEVHLFTILPILGVLLVIQYRENPWARGSALAGLFATAVLVRNELSVAVGLLCLICAGWEFFRWKSTEDVLKPRLMRTACAYLLPFIIAVAIVSACYGRSISKFPLIWTATMREKHVLNMAQVFSFGYSQRHPDWKGDPWTGYQDLMRQHFGKETPSLKEMFAANPEAVTEHILWNFSLVPNGLQVLLFNSTYGTHNPDYAEVKTRRVLPAILSLLLLGTWAIGFALAMRDRHYWWRHLFRPRLLTLLAMMCVAIVSIPVIATQRPRPSYLFGLSVVLMAFTGLWVSVIVQRFAVAKKLAALMPIVMICMCLFVPAHFVDPTRYEPKMLDQAVNRLRPYQFLMAKTDESGSSQDRDIVPKRFDNSKVRFLKGEFAYEVCSYLGRGNCQSFDYRFLSKRSKGQSLLSFLDEHGITLFYLDDNLLTTLAATEGIQANALLSDRGNADWKWVGGQNVPGDRWKLFQRSTPELILGDGWHGLEHCRDGAPFRWVENDAVLFITGRGIARSLILEVEPGFGLAGRSGEFTVADKSGPVLLTRSLSPGSRQRLIVPLPTDGRNNFEVRLCITNGGTAIPSDPRIMNFRVFRAELSLENARPSAGEYKD